MAAWCRDWRRCARTIDTTPRSTASTTAIAAFLGRRDVLFVNEADLARMGLAEGDVVDLSTAGDHAREGRMVPGLMLVRYDLPDGCRASYHPETQPLIALEHADPDILTPAYKSLPVRVRVARVAVGGGGVRADVGVGRGGVSGMVMRVRIIRTDDVLAGRRGLA